MRPPGYWLRAVATRLCGPQTVERLVDPIVADLQMEHAALGEKNVWRRRRLRLSTYVAFWKALSLHVVLAVAQPAPDGARLRRAVGVSLLVLALSTAALTMPPLLDYSALPGDWGFRALLVLLMIPQALPVSIPAAACIGILYAMRAHRATRRDFYGVMMFTVLASTVVWAVIEWAVPGANQAFRELVYAELTGRRVHLEPGLNELGFTALGRRTDAAAVRHYHLMWALSFAPISLGIFALSLAPRIRGARAAATLALTLPVLYYAALLVSDSYLPGRAAAPILLVWAPNALFLAAAIGLRPRWPREAAL